MARRGIIAVVALAASLAAVPCAIASEDGEAAPGDPAALTEPGLALLRGLVEQAFLPELRWASFAEHREVVRRFYADGGDALAWFRGGRPTAQAGAVVQALRRADERGLDPRDYAGPGWTRWLDALRTGSHVDEEERVRFDLALTVSAVRLASDLAMGRLRARAGAADVGLVEPARWDADGLPDLAAIVRGLATTDDVASALAAAEPPFAGYRRTVQALLRYRELAVLDRDGPLPLPRRPLAAGERYAGAEALARRLRLLEDLTDGGAPHGDVYDDALALATARFQRRHGLDPDGRLGARTVRELNVPLDTRAAQLALAVERWRWLPRRFVAPPVVVNIPEFRLHVADPAHRMAMRVVVGRAYRHRTPVFAAALTEVIFRPYWEVPRKIQREELVPRLEQDAARLAEEGYELLDERGRVLPLDAAAGAGALERLRTGAWHLRQRPGPHNALGKVKLVFPNPYQVYLHDTPSQELFARSRRDFSHGCIRVEDAEALAAWVLRDEPGWTPERVRAAMDGAETLWVRVGHPTPVFVLYGTAVVADGGEVRFFGDLYREDAALAAALADEGLRRSGQRPPGCASPRRAGHGRLEPQLHPAAHRADLPDPLRGPEVAQREHGLLELARLEEVRAEGAGQEPGGDGRGEPTPAALQHQVAGAGLGELAALVPEDHLVGLRPAGAGALDRLPARGLEPEEWVRGVHRVGGERGAERPRGRQGQRLHGEVPVGGQREPDLARAVEPGHRVLERRPHRVELAGVAEARRRAGQPREVAVEQEPAGRRLPAQRLQQQEPAHRAASRQPATARTRLRAFSAASSCSASATESATMPPPACRCTRPPATTIVRMATFRSAVPWKPR